MGTLLDFSAFKTLSVLIFSVNSHKAVFSDTCGTFVIPEEEIESKTRHHEFTN